MPRKSMKQQQTGKKLYCLKCKDHTGTVNAEHVQKNGRHAIVGHCSVCGSKKHVFVKAHEAAGILGKLFGMDKIPILGDIPLLGALF